MRCLWIDGAKGIAMLMVIVVYAPSYRDVFRS